MSLNAEEQLGDLAIVPYYTTNEGWATGISVINSSDQTQVVKIRMRRATDSMDALDFNVVMSPEDVWTGYTEKDEEGTIRWITGIPSRFTPTALPTVITTRTLWSFPVRPYRQWEERVSWSMDMRSSIS